MKKLIGLILLGMIAASSINAFAHSGGTDAQGCHVDHRTGIRHCH